MPLMIRQPKLLPDKVFVEGFSRGILVKRIW